MQAKKLEQGFTMVEPMITIAVIGILVAVGLPSYSNAIRKSNRSEAQSALMPRLRLRGVYQSRGDALSHTCLHFAA